MAKACSQAPADVIARFVATATDRDTTDPLPDRSAEMRWNLPRSW